MKLQDKYICTWCGEVIDYDDIRWEVEDTGEKWGCCPYCHEDLTEAYACEKCGKPFDPETLINDWCEECLMDALTIESFRDFAVADFSETECSLLEEFMLVKEYGFDYADVPNVSTIAFRDMLFDEYQRKANSNLRGDLEQKIRNYVKALYWGEWADYIAEKGGV